LLAEGRSVLADVTEKLRDVEGKIETREAEWLELMEALEMLEVEKSDASSS
jgi:hypothetical protein